MLLHQFPRAPYLESVIGKAEPQLSADHHGLHGPPALAAHGSPDQRAVSLCQHLDATLVRVPAAVEPQLRKELVTKVTRLGKRSNRTGCDVTLWPITSSVTDASEGKLTLLLKPMAGTLHRTAASSSWLQPRASRLK